MVRGDVCERAVAVDNSPRPAGGHGLHLPPHDHRQMQSNRRGHLEELYAAHLAGQGEGSPRLIRAAAALRVGRAGNSGDYMYLMCYT